MPENYYMGTQGITVTDAEETPQEPEWTCDVCFQAMGVRCSLRQDKKPTQCMFPKPEPKWKKVE